MKKRRLLLALLLCALVVAGLIWWGLGSPMPSVGPWRFVGSKYADNYHTHDCLWADQIRSENRVYFSSAEAAERRGYRPCPLCIR